MTRAQKRALEAHPDGYAEYVRHEWVRNMGKPRLKTVREGIGADYSHERKIYVEGYNKAIEDALSWFAENNKIPFNQGYTFHDCISDFRKNMEEIEA